MIKHQLAAIVAVFGLTAQSHGACFAQVTPPLVENFDHAPGKVRDAWRVISGDWRVADGALVVNSMDAEAAGKLMDEFDSAEFNLVDVRQPKEYRAGHLPGAQLLPMVDLIRKSTELDPNLPTIVY